MKKLLFCILTVSALLMSGCSDPIPPGYVGKIVGTQGVEPEIYGTGRVTIMPWSRDRLILLETASVLRPAPVNVIMADRYLDDQSNEQVRPGLKMNFTLNVRYRIDSNPKVINAALKDMKLSSGVGAIAAQDFYNKYGNMAVGQVSREVLGKYTPQEVLKNLDAINAALLNGLKDKLNGTPLIISNASLGPIALPATIQDQIDLNKKTELSETQRRAEQKIALLEKQNEIELAKQQALREKVDALSLAEQNRILNSSVTSEVLRLRELQLKEKEIDMMRDALANGGNNTVFIPYGAMDSAGAQMRMFQK